MQSLPGFYSRHVRLQNVHLITTIKSANWSMTWSQQVVNFDIIARVRTNNSNLSHPLSFVTNIQTFCTGRGDVSYTKVVLNGSRNCLSIFFLSDLARSLDYLLVWNLLVALREYFSRDKVKHQTRAADTRSSPVRSLKDLNGWTCVFREATMEKVVECVYSFIKLHRPFGWKRNLYLRPRGRIISE